MADMTVSNEIYRQMGGRKMAAMIGVKNLVGGENFLQFNFSLYRKANKCRITLTALDLYTMEFFKVVMPTARNGFTYKEELVHTHEFLYDDMLVSTFETQTGLSLRL